MKHINDVKKRSEEIRRQFLVPIGPGPLLSFVIIVIALSFSLSSLTLPGAEATGSIPFFQLGPEPNESSLFVNGNNNTKSNNNLTMLKTYENPGFGISINYPSSWSGTQLRADPLEPTNSSIVAIFEAPLENRSDSYRENLILGVQGPRQEGISLEEYTQNSLSAFRSMSDRVRILGTFPSSLSGLPAHELVYMSNLQNLNLKKIQIFTIVNGNLAYIVTFGAEESKFDRYVPEIRKMVDSIRINQQTTG